MNYKEWNKECLLAEVIYLKNRECNLICTQERMYKKIDTIIGWCQANIQDQTQVTAFAVQIRDCLEKDATKNMQRDDSSELTKALLLAKEMIISNGLDIPKTMAVINEALNA